MLRHDLIITAVQVVLSISLIPMLFARSTGPPYSTSVPTWIGLWFLGTTFWDLGLLWSSVTAFWSGTIWFLLVIKRDAMEPYNED